MSDCIFCRILEGLEPASFVFRDERAAVFVPLQPVNPGHVLVVPVHHAVSLEELGPSGASEIAVVAQRLSQALRRSDVMCEGVNLLLSDGGPAGQAVPHVHLHVFPRFRGDGFGFRFGPDWGSRPPRDQLDAMAASVRVGLDRLGDDAV